MSHAFADQLDLASNVAPHYPGELPTAELTLRMELAARLINANLGFRVLTASWADFDSHALQPNMHPIRMTELNSRGRASSTRCSTRRGRAVSR